MIRLSLLGSVDLTGPDGRQILSVLAQPKRVALLAYLAVAGGYVRRDTLLGVFWPESDEEHARHALRQALYSLRRSLGPRVIESRGDEELHTESSRLWCDAAAFEEAVVGGQPGKALDLYGGDLLEGFFLSEAPGFEKWLDGRRAALRGRAAEAAWALAETAEREGTAAEAAEWARKAAEYAPEDEASLRRLIGLLDRIGDRAAALRAYEAFAWRLESELGAEPSPETQAMIADVRTRSVPEPLAEPPGTRSAAPPPIRDGTPPTVRVGSPSSRPDESLLAGPPALTPESGRVESGDEAAAGPEPEVPAVKKHRALIGVLVAVLAASAAIIDGAEIARWAASWFSGGGQGAAQPQASMARPADLDPKRIAVLYFEDFSEDQSLEYVASGFTETLIQRLSQIEGLQIISRNGVKPFRDGNVTTDSIIKALTPGTIVEGSVMGGTDLIRVNIQLIDANTLENVGAQTLERPSSEQLALLDDLSGQVVEFLRERLGDVVRTRQLRTGTESQEAWNRVQRAELALEDATRLRFSGNNEEAARLYARADTLLAEAERLDSKWVDPIVQRGWVAAGRARLAGDTPISYDRSALEAGIEHATRALELSPNNVPALELRGSLYADVALGNPPEEEYEAALDAAFTDSETAVAVDREAAGAWATLSMLNGFLGRFEEARMAVEQALEADAFLERAVDIYYLAASTALNQREFAETVYWVDRGLARSPGDKRFAAVRLVAAASGAEITLDDAWEAVRILERTEPEYKWPSHWLKMSAVLARSGLEDSARSVIRRAHEVDTDYPLVDYYEAYARLLLGERAEAIRLLGRFLERVPNMRTFVAEEWWFEPLRDDPEFQSLVATTD